MRRMAWRPAGLWLVSLAAGGVFLTPVATLANPYPSGILQPIGNSAGSDTFSRPFSDHVTALVM